MDRSSSEHWIKLLDGLLKGSMDEKFEEAITGIGLFYRGYIVNILEVSLMDLL